MIQSKKDYKFYLEADRISKGISEKYSLSDVIKNIFFPDYTWEFQKTLRKLEYYKNCKKNTLFIIHRFFITKKFRRLSLKLGFIIPTNVIGPGLSIAHYGPIIVNSGAKIGANCRIHIGVNIGTEAGYSNKAPTIGDNCYLGPGAKIYGSITIANGTAIGANAVVNKSFDEENIAIAGVPAKKIGNVDPLKLIIPGAQLVDKGY